MRRADLYSLFALLAALTLALFAPGCGGGDDDDDDDNDDNDTGDDTADDDSGDDDTGDAFAEAEANPGQWVWIPVDGAICRDGSPAGFGVRLQEGAQNVMIYMQGGGACYSVSSCEDNPAFFGAADLSGIAGTDLSAGIFNTTEAANPVGDWNAVFLPYCTGDLFVGNQANGVVPDIAEPQQFVGHPNMTKFMDLLGPYFADQTNILLAGASAGGFGSFLNYAVVADAFPETPVVLFDDSGPILSDDAALAPCYQLLVRILWNADPSIPEACTECFDPDGMPALHTYFAETYPAGTFGLFSSFEDATIRDFFGLGQNDCTGEEPIPADVFTAALENLRDDVLLPTGRWGTYYIAGDTHTCTEDDAMFFGTTVGDVAVTDWLADLIAGTASQVAATK